MLCGVRRRGLLFHEGLGPTRGLGKGQGTLARGGGGGAAVPPRPPSAPLPSPPGPSRAPCAAAPPPLPLPRPPDIKIFPKLTLVEFMTRNLLLKALEMKGTAPQRCFRREGASEAAPEAVRQAVGGGCQSGWGRLLSVTNATEAGTCRSGTVAGHRLGALEGGMGGGGTSPSSNAPLLPPPYGPGAARPAAISANLQPGAFGEPNRRLRLFLAERGRRRLPGPMSVARAVAVAQSSAIGKRR